MVSGGDVQVSHAPDEPKVPQKFAVPETTQIAQGSDCDVVLDSIDTCVACVEGVDMQHRFEEGLRQQALQQRKIAKEHGLSEAEAAMIRLQMLDGEAAVGSSLPELDLDMINLCGNDETTDDQMCVGMVSPTDTTLQTTNSGDELVHSSGANRRRSLVDAPKKMSTTT
jgi:hypothetical protein